MDRPPVRFIDWFMDSMEEIHERLIDALESGELSYDEGIVVKNSHLQAARWIDSRAVEGALLDYLEARNQRTETELNFYRDKQDLDEVDPTELMDRFKREQDGE